MSLSLSWSPSRLLPRVCWDGESNVVDVYINDLRRKVDQPFDRKLIHTVRGAGYTLGERA